MSSTEQNTCKSKKAGSISVVLIYLLFSGHFLTHAQNVNSEVFRFLNLPNNPRIAALGGNHPALLKGDGSIFQVNPAYLTGASNNDISLSYISFLSDVNYAVANWSHQIKGIGMLGAGISYIGFGDFERTNELGEVLGDFNANELAFSIGLGRKFGEQIRYGASFNFIHSNLDRFNSTAIAFSAGGQYLTHSGNTIFGLSFRNAGTQISTFNNKNEDLPFDILVGASHKLQHTPLRFALTLQKLDNWVLEIAGDESDDPSFFKNAARHLVVGTELLLSDNLHFRIGYNQFDHDNLSTSNRLDTAGMNFGMGIFIKEFRFNISRSSFSDLGGSTQISLEASL